MLLPGGITGFFDGRRDAAPPAVDPKSFARACHAAARAESGSVERFEPAGIARNYHRVILRLRDDAIAVLCNAHVPWIAFAEASDDVALRFREATALASRIKDALPCEVVSLSSLEALPDAELLANLGAVEREQIRYWRPQRLGDIIFNFWD
jgi:hypothetical protein